MSKKIFTYAISAMLAGCTSVPMGDEKQDVALKEFKAPPGKTGIFIYRNEIMGGGVRMDILINGLDMGSTAQLTYLYKEVEPGKYRITSKAGNSDSISINAQSDTLIFIWQEVKMGAATYGSKLHIVSEQEGKKGVNSTKLAVQ